MAVKKGLSPEKLRNTFHYAAVVLSLSAGFMHIWVAPEHFDAWWGYGAFFVGAAVAQVGYGLAMPLLNRRPLFVLGIIGNLSIIALYVVTRTVGIPTGPHKGEVEEMEAVGLTATTIEAVLIVALAVLLRITASEKVRLG